MDQVQKILRKLSTQERQKFEALKDQLLQGHFENLDCVPIKSKPDFFRVRVGRYRFIFSGKKSGTIRLHKIVKRDENTYKDL